MVVTSVYLSRTFFASSTRANSGQNQSDYLSGSRGSRDISERICGVVCQSVKRDISRHEVEWDVVNQELMWHEFSEAVLLLMPVLGSRLAIDQFRFLKRSKHINF